MFWNRMGYKLSLNNPKTFSEKLQWLKLYDRNPDYTNMVDKYEVKSYVSKVIGDEYIIPTLGVWDSPKSIDWDSLPSSFVLKTTHDGGGCGVVIVKDKNSIDKRSAIAKLEMSLKENVYKLYAEWPYKNVKKRVIAEKYIEDNQGDSNELMDYKFFCFNGHPRYCQVISGRNSNMSIDFFDMNWCHQPFHEPKFFPFSNQTISKPKKLSEMIELSEKLSKDHPFLRVDFFQVNGKVYFGELTFYPTSGMGGFSPEQWDVKFGDMIELPLKMS
jgi:hypothetical protein